MHQGHHRESPVSCSHRDSTVRVLNHLSAPLLADRCPYRKRDEGNPRVKGSSSGGSPGDSSGYRKHQLYGEVFCKVVKSLHRGDLEVSCLVQLKYDTTLLWTFIGWC